MAIDIANPGADEADLRAALNKLVFGTIDLNGASMVHFPGRTAYLKKATALTGVANGRKGTCSFLFNDLGWAELAGTDPTIAYDVLGNASVFDIATGFGNGVAITLTPAVSAGALSGICINVYLNDGGAGNAHTMYLQFLPMNWLRGQNNQVVITWDLTNPPVTWAAQVNGVNCYSMANLLPVAMGDFDYIGSADPDTQGFFGISSLTSGGGANFGNVFLDLVNALSMTNGIISVTDGEKFFRGGQVQSLGSDGSLPFGVVPAIYFRGNASSIVTNRGSGGAFTLTGSLSDV